MLVRSAKKFKNHSFWVLGQNNGDAILLLVCHCASQTSTPCLSFTKGNVSSLLSLHLSLFYILTKNFLALILFCRIFLIPSSPPLNMLLAHSHSLKQVHTFKRYLLTTTPSCLSAQCVSLPRWQTFDYFPETLNVAFPLLKPVWNLKSWSLIHFHQLGGSQSIVAQRTNRGVDKIWFSFKLKHEHNDILLIFWCIMLNNHRHLVTNKALNWFDIYCWDIYGILSPHHLTQSTSLLVD